jgi:hypothetical protein
LFLLKKYTLPLFLCVILSTSNTYSQEIENKKVPIILSDFLFTESNLKEHKVKEISVSFWNKKTLKPIKKEYYKSVHYLINENGKLIRSYFTKKTFGTQIDTAVEWRYYSQNKLTAIKKTAIGGIKVKSIFYENNKPSIFIFGRSKNSSPNITTLILSSYQDEDAEYIEYTSINPRDTLIKYKSVTDVVFKKELKEWIDSNIYRVSVNFPLDPEKNYTHTFTYAPNKTCESIEISKFNSEKHRYVMKYTDEGKIISYTKFNVNKNTSTDFSELIYNENNGLLRAVITKNLFDNSIFIKKYSYMYYE